MEKIIPVDASLVRSWIGAKLSPADVEEQLNKSGFSEENIAAYLREYKKERYAARRFNGFVCAGVGAFLGFLSCVLSIINPIPELYHIILFGLTSVAILIICLGLYFVFE
ncbi:MAG: hypothetical protein IT249_13710 [Chitinophagaceae bacterium]|nr:hypothetical protein [Chitinophagaceae bacterium]